MKKLFILLLFIEFSNLYAQNTLTGKITDSNNTPLLGVEIYAPNLHKGTTSLEDGTYTFKNIPNGKVIINFSFIGYKTVSKTLAFSNQDLTFDIQLEESIFKIDEVIISTPFNKLQSENVMKVERLSARAIQKTGATTLAEGLSSIAGVTQVSTGVSIGKPVIRGLSGNRVLVYTQGVRLENQQFGGEHGLGINAAGVEGVEVIKGPASLLYGSDALGGVLYIQPEKFASENKTNVNVQQRFYSNTLGSNTSVGVKSSLQDWQFLARGTYAFHSDYKIPTEQRVTNTRFNEKDLKLGVGYHSKNFSSELRYNFNDSELGLTEGIGEQSTETHLELPYQSINNHILSLHNHIFFKNSKLDIDLGYIVNSRKEFEEHEDHDPNEPLGAHEEHAEGEAALDMSLKTFSYNTKYHLPKFGDVEVLVGLQGMHQTNKNFGEELLIPNATVNDIGVFTTANYSINDDTALQAGIRFDNRSIDSERHEITHENEVHVFNAINKSFNSFTASLGFKTKLFNLLTTRLNIANGFRAPNLAELTSNGVHHGTNRFEEGNNDLVNEKNLQFDLALEYDTEHFELFANGFYNAINNYIYLSPTGEIEDGVPVYTYLQESAKLYGGEFGFHLHPHPLDWLHLESSFETVIGKRDTGNYLPLIPANVFKNQIRGEFDINKWFQQAYASVSLHSYLDQNRVSEFETTTPAYSLLNLSIGGDFILNKYKFTTSLIVNNLLNEKYINHLSRLKSDGILNPGRNFVFSLQFNL
ncbi:TonB-dependent receptor [Tenacibaculum sp. TC6]|uniref:TonB-dependent receptor n=1 Tax=Tenacibaculum sp. TC6 TaxID=3423223 RepID=UPI003D35D8E0